jgi:hypothetical protein
VAWLRIFGLALLALLLQGGAPAVAGDWPGGRLWVAGESPRPAALLAVQPAPCSPALRLLRSPLGVLPARAFAPPPFLVVPIADAAPGEGRRARRATRSPRDPPSA